MTIREDPALVQFEHVNALRNYPFAACGSRKDRRGREIPQDVVVDVHLVVPAQFENPESGLDGTELPTVRLASAHLSPGMVSVCFVSELGGSRQALAVTVARTAFRPFVPYRLEKLVGTEDFGGVVTFGAFDFPGSPETYFLDNAVIDPGCCAFSRPSSLRKFIDARSGASVSGDAQISFSGYVRTARRGKAFALSLEDGADAELASDCAKATGLDVCGATPIRSINGIRPDADGNIVLWFH